MPLRVFGRVLKVRYYRRERHSYGQIHSGTLSLLDAHEVGCIAGLVNLQDFELLVRLSKSWCRRGDEKCHAHLHAVLRHDVPHGIFDARLLGGNSGGQRGGGEEVVDSIGWGGSQ